ncbi:MAG: hypothetical protein ACI9GM_001261 [Salibacteraceae bacterium]|jgi:hypothetical protein
MKYLLLISAVLIGFAGFCQPTETSGTFSFDFSYNPVKFYDIGVMVNSATPDSQQPEETKMISFGGAINGGVIFPMVTDSDWKTGIRLSGGIFVHRIENKENAAQSADRMNIHAKALGYLNFTPNGSGPGLVLGTKYSLGPFSNLTGIIGAEYVGGEAYSIVLYTATNPFIFEYDLSNGGNSQMMKMGEIGITLLLYP